MISENSSDIPPFKEYILSSDKQTTISLLRKEQVFSLIGEHISSLKPAMVLSVPAVGGPSKTPLYDWRDVRTLASELGVAIPCVPANGGKHAY